MPIVVRGPSLSPDIPLQSGHQQEFKKQHDWGWGELSPHMHPQKAIISWTPCLLEKNPFTIQMQCT